MKNYTFFLISLGILLNLFGCEAVDKAKREFDRIKEQLDTLEYGIRRGTPHPEYQSDPSKKTRLISSQCSSNEAIAYTYYNTPEDAYNNHLNDIKNLISYSNAPQLKPFWDIRYVNPVTKYINNGTYNYYANHSKYTGLDVRSGPNNIGIGTSASKTDASGSIAQLKCIDGQLTGGNTLNLYDAPNQSINYGGPHTSFKYILGSTSLSSPWKANKTGNLMLQAHFNTPLYINPTQNIGGGISFAFFLQNKNNGKRLNYVIGAFVAGQGWIREKSGIQYDPTTQTIHVATVVRKSSWWSTISLQSKPIEALSPSSYKDTHTKQEWNNFYRVNVSYKNLLLVLQELKDNPPKDVTGEDFGLSPEDWEITSIMIQSELDEQGGEAMLSYSFRGFEAYTSQLPL